MDCAACGAEVREGDAFCGSCGAAVPPRTPPGMPAVSASAEPAQGAYDAATYAEQQAVYEQQRALYEQQQAAYEQQMASQQQYAQPAPAKKRKTGPLIAVVAVVLLMLAGCAVAGVLAVRALPSLNASLDGTGDESPEEGPPAQTPGYASAAEAAQAALDAEGLGDWVLDVYDEGDGYAVYWAGPPNSEFVVEYVLEEDAVGLWQVVEATELDVSDGAFADDSPEAWEAMMVVNDHLTAVSEDRGLDAQALTVDPYRSDSASAQVSAGGLGYWDVAEALDQGDGTFWVRTNQTWYDAEERWEYQVVPTEAGYRIADVRPW